MSDRKQLTVQFFQWKKNQCLLLIRVLVSKTIFSFEFSIHQIKNSLSSPFISVYKNSDQMQQCFIFPYSQMICIFRGVDSRLCILKCKIHQVWTRCHWNHICIITICKNSTKENESTRTGTFTIAKQYTVV